MFIRLLTSYCSPCLPILDDVEFYEVFLECALSHCVKSKDASGMKSVDFTVSIEYPGMLKVLNNKSESFKIFVIYFTDFAENENGLPFCL